VSFVIWQQTDLAVAQTLDAVTALSALAYSHFSSSSKTHPYTSLMDVQMLLSDAVLCMTVARKLHFLFTRQWPSLSTSMYRVSPIHYRRYFFNIDGVIVYTFEKKYR